MSSDIRREISNLLKSKFGDEIEKMLKNYYEDSAPDEIIGLARHMLSGLVGEEMANELINKILEKHKNYKKPLIVGS